MSSAERLVRDLDGKVFQELSRVGLLFRSFFRAKTERSIRQKIAMKQYAIGDRLMQDLLGLRVTLYFADDVEIVCSVLREVFGMPCSETIDAPDVETFKPSRVNLVFPLPQAQKMEMAHLIRDRPIDSTFEVQVRTVLAEGWHEVEHDLRYKVPDDWEGCDDLSRALNGVVATLETCDWSMLQLFDELAHRHYRTRQWSSMVRHKFRMRFTTTNLSAEVAGYLSQQPEVAKRIFRVDRTRFLRTIMNRSVSIPLTLDNVVHAANVFFFKDVGLIKLAPKPIIEILNGGAD